MQNITLLSLHVLSHFSMAPFYTINNNNHRKLSVIINSRFSHYFTNIIYSNTEHHSTTIEKNTFSHILDSPVLFSSETCGKGSQCCFSTQWNFEKNQIITEQTITNQSFPNEFGSKNSFFENDECGDLKISKCQFVCCYSKTHGGGIRVEQSCEVILHNCIFDQCYSQKHGGAASITKEFKVESYTDNNIHKERLSDPAHQFTDKLDIQYSCFQSCYSIDGNDFGTALILGSNVVKFYFASTVDCPKASSKMPYGAQFDIQANSISSQFINCTGGKSVYCGAMEYRNATHGFFQYQTIAELDCKYAIAFTSVVIDNLEIKSCNIVNNKVHRNSDYDNNESAFPSLVFIRFKDLLIENFYFKNNDFGIDGKLASIEKGDTLTVKLLNCFTDTNNAQNWEHQNVNTENCNFGNAQISTFPLRQLNLGRCQGNMPPGPMIISDFFTASNTFSYSEMFTKSEGFTETDGFTQTGGFSKSSDFSRSSMFTKTGYFSESGPFSVSDKFTSSGHFTTSAMFSTSAPFTGTSGFTKTSGFTHTEAFTVTGEFSESFKFTPSKKFTPSYKWNQTHFFTPSHTFTSSKKFSKSSDFSDSADFTKSKYFTLSSAFSETKGFSETDHFTHSSYFTRTSGFSETDYFSNSHGFTESGKFSLSDEFIKSNEFSASEYFSASGSFCSTSEFSASSSFTPSDRFTSSNTFTPSDKFTDTFVFSGSFNFSASDAFIVERGGNIGSSNKIGTGAIIGAVIGALAAAAIIIALILFFVMRKKRQPMETDSANIMNETDSSITIDNNLNSIMDKDDPFAADFHKELDDLQ